MNKQDLNKMIKEEKLRKETEAVRTELRQIIIRLKIEKRINYWVMADVIWRHHSRISKFMAWVPMELWLLKLYLKKLRKYERSNWDSWSMNK